MNHSSRVCSLTAGFVVSILLAACSAPGTPPAAPAGPALPGEKFKLANGLEVILLEDHRLPLVAVNLWYHVGPADERPGRTGFAHLFEHMMFQGSKHTGPDRHFALLEAAGASSINGSTSLDRTNYYETLPSNQLELALWIESDRMGFLLESVDAAMLANQRDVVRNERRQTTENQPYGLVQEALYHELFPKGHPYYASIIGSHADIEAARLGDVREFFQQYYVPNNASLAIVGDIDPAKTRALVEKYFGSLPAGAAVSKPSVETPPITAERRIKVTDQVELPRLYLAWHTAPVFTPGDAEARVLANILGGGKSSRLYQKLVYEKQLAQDVSVDQDSEGLISVFSIDAVAKPGVRLERLEEAIDEELASVVASGPTVEELARARNTFETQAYRDLENVGGVADRLNMYNHYRGDPGYLATDLARYKTVTAQAIQQLAKQTLTKQSRVVVYGVPGKKVIDDVPRTVEPPAQSVAAVAASKRPDSKDEAWRAQQPAAGVVSALALPEPQRFDLDNGLRVYLVEQRNLPVIAAKLIVHAGSESNPLDRPGLASFTADLLDEGTTKRTALQIANEAAQLGADLSTGSGSDAATLSLYTLKAQADKAFALFADITRNPAFPENEITRIRDDRLTLLMKERDSPNAIAGRAFASVVYGPKHPYGVPDLGSEASVRAISREDLLKFWNSRYAPQNAALILAGDLTVAEARTLAQNHFQGWKNEGWKNEGWKSDSEKDKAAVSDATPAGVQPGGMIDAGNAKSAARRIVLIDRGTSPQTALRIGQVGVERTNADYVPLEVMNTILGGLFSSRINLNLREKNGYTYGARSGFSFRRGPGPFTVGTSVRSDVTAPAVREIFNEIEHLRAEPITDAELMLAKDYFARGLPANFRTNNAIVDSIGQLFVYGLPLNYYTKLPLEIDRVTQADVQRVAKQYLHPDQMVVVAVGDRARVERELIKLRLGKVESGEPGA